MNAKTVALNHEKYQCLIPMVIVKIVSFSFLCLYENVGCYFSLFDIYMFILLCLCKYISINIKQYEFNKIRKENIMFLRFVDWKLKPKMKCHPC